MQRAALEAARLGIPVFPVYEVHDGGRCACDKPSCSSAGKHPRTRNGLKAATTDEAQICTWWERWPDANIGGAGGNLICLDVDVRAGGLDSLRQLEAEHGAIPDGAVAKTGRVGRRRGRHYWFTNPNGVAVSTRAGVRPGIDIRAKDGYAVLPPSRHVSGVRYEWISAPTLAPAPEWVLELSRHRTSRDASQQAPIVDFRSSEEVREFVAGTRPVLRGEQRDFLLRATRSLLTAGGSVEEVSRLLFDGGNGEGGLAVCEQDPATPWRYEQVEELVEDLFRKGPTTSLKRDFSDPFWHTEDGTAHRFAEAVRSEIRFVPERKAWLVWQGDRWAETPEVKVRDRVSEFVRSAIGAAQSLDNDAYQSQLKWARQFLSRARLGNVAELAKGPLLAHANEFDSHPELLNFRNGTLDLVTFELRPHESGDMLTQQVHAAYEPGARSADWERVLRESMRSDDLVSYLQRVFGYCLTGDTSEEKLWFFYGKPGAGKGTIVESFAGAMGDYARTVNHKSLVQSPGGSGASHSEDIARLHGARFVAASEFERSEKFASALVNNLTGGDTIAAREMYQGTFEFRPQFTLFFAANHKPKMPNTLSGIWRRLQTVPFEHVPKKPDRALKARLATDEARAAILAWAIEGLRLWRADGLGPVPVEVVAANEAYKEESDPYSLFLDERVEPVRGEWTPVDRMYRAYEQWCSLTGRTAAQKAGFGSALKDRGIEQVQRQRNGEGGRAWNNVKVSMPIRIPGDDG